MELLTGRSPSDTLKPVFPIVRKVPYRLGFCRVVSGCYRMVSVTMCTAALS